MPSNAKNVDKCKHQQWLMCKADDVIASLHKHCTDINCFLAMNLLVFCY